MASPSIAWLSCMSSEKSVLAAAWSAAATMSESKIEMPVSLRDVDGSLVGLDREWRWAKNAKYVKGAANFLPALIKLASRHRLRVERRANAEHHRRQVS
jgi:hypothetical protein